MLGLDAYGSSDDEEEAQTAPFVEVKKTWNHTKHNKNQLLMAEMVGEFNQRARPTESTGRWCVRGARNKPFPFLIS